MTIAMVYTGMAFGGVERVFCELANGFVEQGLGVDLVLYKAAGPFLEDVDKRVNVVNLNILRHPYSLFAFGPLAGYLRRRRPEAVLSAVSGPNVAVLLALRLLRLKSRSIVTYHSSVGNESIPWVLQKMQNLLYRSAHRVVAVSSGAADELAAATKLPRAGIEVIYNPVNTDGIERASREDVTDLDWFGPGQPPVILGAGRLLLKQKGFEVLIKAVSLLRRKRRARLLLLGDGPSRAALEAMIADEGFGDDARLPGFMTNPYKYMRRAAVFVLPSIFEGLPMVLVEALACGCPVVATDCPHGPREILEGGRWGRLIPVGDAEAMAGAIEETLAAPLPAGDLIGRAGFFRPERAVDRYLQFLGDENEGSN